MTAFISDIAFTPAVKQQQEQRGSRETVARVAESERWTNRITPDLAAFLAARDSLYFATSNAAGQPYIQHRGGPIGFLKVLDDRRFGFADLAGNRHYISLGNLTENGKVFVFLMDYPNQNRIKIWGHAEVIEDDPDLLERLTVPGYPARAERSIVITVRAWDVNCRQHIMPRYTPGQVEAAVAPLQERIANLEARLRLAGVDP
jgi:uncharacterized protein